jgi:hypothetical protein
MRELTKSGHVAEPTGNVRLDRNQIGESWHSAEHSGLWKGLRAPQNRVTIAKTGKAVVWGMSADTSCREHGLRHEALG